MASRDSRGLPIITISLRIRGVAFDPAVVTEQLGVTPSVAYRTGDAIANGQGRRRTDGWVVTVGPHETLDGAAVFDELLARFPASGAAIREICADVGAEAQVYCTIEPTSSLTPAVSIGHDVLSWILACGAELDIDFLLWGDDEEDDSARAVEASKPPALSG
jgi:hypothetical protein